MRNIAIASLLLILFAFTSSDTLKLITITDATQVSADRYGNIYVCDKKYNVTKYTTSGEEQEKYSPKRFADITSFEAWSSINLLLFYKDYQEYILLDRFLTEKGSATLNSDLVGFARVATLSYDNNIWLIDDQDFSLKKYEIKYNSLLVNNPLDLVLNPKTYNIVSLREYQNNLYANDLNSGILVFDNLGNYKKTLDIKDVNQYSFYDEELYYIKNDSIFYHGLYTPIDRKEPLPASIHPEKLLITDNGFYFFEANKMYIRKK